MENSTSSKKNGHTNHYAIGCREAKQSLVELYRKEKKIIRSLDLVVELQTYFMEEAALELAFEMDVSVSGFSLPDFQLVGSGGNGVYHINN